jgi:2-polyprenyl-6-methoxyphenol hydroxylase-like FAD-dependent oxidoreductase
MGLIDRLAAQQIPFEALVYVNQKGKRIAKLDAALIRNVTDGKYMALMHSALEEGLYEALAGHVEVCFGRSLTHIVSGSDAVVVTFNDGTTESFDLLIGADGVYSTTRALVFGPEDQFSRYLGYTIACYPLADRYGIGRSSSCMSSRGRAVAAYCTPQADQILTFFMYRTVQQEHLPREQRLPRLQGVFGGMGWLTQQFLADVILSASVFMDAVLQIQMPSWHQGRVALVGDACDCPTLLSGQGASLAMGGAYLLAHALQETVDYPQAFRRYEQQLFATVQAQQKSGRGFAKFFVPGSPLGLAVQRTMMGVLLRPAFRGLLRRQFEAESVLSLQDAKPTQQAVQQEGLPYS